MTNREAILRLAVDAEDTLAMTSLRDNTAQVVHAAVSRYFGSGIAANKAESALMLRMADRARSYDGQEDADEWFARQASLECDRLRNEGIHEKANRD